MKIEQINASDELWNKTIEYANNCSWSAGPYLAKEMTANNFTQWERVIVATENDCVAGFCTFTKTDCIPDVPYTPYIGFMFVGEEFRGHRLSEKLIHCALDYAGELGFEKVYLVSDHINLYEKYGFVQIDEKPDHKGRLEKIYEHIIMGY